MGIFIYSYDIFHFDYNFNLKHFYVSVIIILYTVLILYLGVESNGYGHQSLFEIQMSTLSREIQG